MNSAESLSSFFLQRCVLFYYAADVNYRAQNKDFFFACMFVTGNKELQADPFHFFVNAPFIAFILIFLLFTNRFSFIF